MTNRLNTKFHKGSVMRGRLFSGAAAGLLLLLVCCLLSGCRNKTADAAENEKGEGDYLIYYTDQDGLSLVTRSYHPQAENFDGILNELLEQLITPLSGEVSSAIPSSVRINGCVMGIDNLTVDLNASYLGLTNIQQVLLRAAIVKTLVQLPGVISVSITEDGQQILEPDGTAATGMNDDSFVISSGQGINSYRVSPLKLFFATPNGDTLAEEMRSTFYSTNVIMEKVVTDQVIAGPANTALQPVVSPSLLVNSVTVTQDGICQIDLDDTFLDDYNQQVSPEACLYAFVNSVCSNCEVTGVQFLIDGESDVRFRDQIPLNQVFTMDPKMVGGKGSSKGETE